MSTAPLAANDKSAWIRDLVFKKTPVTEIHGKYI